jgi:hypothetical protein
MYFNIHSSSCAPVERDLPSLATIFSQALSPPRGCRASSTIDFEPRQGTDLSEFPTRVWVRPAGELVGAFPHRTPPPQDSDP